MVLGRTIRGEIGQSQLSHEYLFFACLCCS